MVKMNSFAYKQIFQDFGEYNAVSRRTPLLQCSNLAHLGNLTPKRLDVTHIQFYESFTFNCLPEAEEIDFYPDFNLPIQEMFCLNREEMKIESPTLQNA